MHSDIKEVKAKLTSEVKIYDQKMEAIAKKGMEF